MGSLVATYIQIMTILEHPFPPHAGLLARSKHEINDTCYSVPTADDEICVMSIHKMVLCLGQGRSDVLGRGGQVAGM